MSPTPAPRRRVITRLRARGVLRKWARAEFLAERAPEEGVHIALIGSSRDPTVFIWAPTALTGRQQIAWERGFRAAGLEKLGAVAIPRGCA
jgi:hypothetical protein